MSHLTFTLEACPNLQEKLNQYFLTSVVEPMPAMEFIASAINKSGLTQKIAPGSGKVRSIDLLYTQRLMEDEVLEDQANPTCSATNQTGNVKETYTIDTTQNVQRGEKYSVNDLKFQCESNPDFFASRVAAIVDVIERKLATNHITDLAALTGKYATDAGANGSDEFEVKTKYSDGRICPEGMADLDLALLQTGFPGNKIIFGDKKLYAYYKALQAGCCSTQGIDLSAVLAEHGMAVAYDRRVASSFGTDKGVVLTPGSAILLHWTMNEWLDGVLPQVAHYGAESYLTIVSPRLGIPMDLMVKYDCGNVHIVVTATTKLVAAPDDMFEVGDIYRGVNFINKVKAIAASY